jgi:RNA polymerase sigma factor (sigma-70 family)
MNFYKISNLDIKMLYISNYCNGDSSWKYKLFNDVQFFAKKRSKKYQYLSYYEDIAQEAFLGLWMAIDTYDYKKNFDFYRWAQWNISSKIRNTIYENKKNSKAKYSKKKNAIGYYEGEQLGSFFLNEVLFEKEILNDKESKIIFNNVILEKTLSDSGKEIGVSAERVRQIKQKAILKLQKSISVRG